MRDVVDRRYRVEQKLAVGGFGAVYRATDLVIGREVALKILHRELAADPRVVARFRRESATLARLKSAHTLTLYDVGETEDTLYFVMELLRGECLQDVFERSGALPWRRVVHVMRGVCSSLREAHALGIVHRDLKPANIFLEQHALAADFVKVLDFGIAKIVIPSLDLDSSDLTHHGQMVGTFDYMAPEQMVGCETSAASDLFTLGVVMYELLTGARPFGDADGPAQMMMAMMTTKPRPLTGVPPELAGIVMRCLDREPNDRPDVTQLDAVLARVLAVDAAAFGDTDEATVITAQPPRRPRAPSPAPRITLPRGSATPLHVAPELADVAAPRARVALAEPPVVARTASPVAAPAVARGSSAAIGSHVDLAFEATWSGEAPAFAVGTNADAAADVVVRFAPAPGGSVPTPRSRLAAGTASPVDGDRSPALRPAASAYLRYAVIAACLFALGFIAAFALWS